MTELELARDLAAAGLAGAAVGLEREWSGHASGPDARFAGVRTFFLLGLLGGVAGYLVGERAAAAGVAVLLGGAAIVVGAYVMAARRGAVDGTTEVAALVVLGLGLLAGLGEIRVASGAAAVTVLALGEKTAIRRFIAKIGTTEMQAALQFAVLALVVLPLLPEGPYGPFDSIRPRTLWAVVLLFSGLNFVGYLVRRAVGEARGYPVAGALGGIVSSTAVTLSFARESRRHPEQSSALGLGVVAACVVLVPRVLLLVLTLNTDFAFRALASLTPMLLAGTVVASLWWFRSRPPTDEPPPAGAGNPLQLGSAIRMALAFQVVLIAIDLAAARFGQLGVYAGAVVVGLTDVDALTLGMSRLASDPVMAPAARGALLAGIISNTVLKAGVAFAFGAPRFRRRVVPALLGIGLVGAIGWLVGRGGP